MMMTNIDAALKYLNTYRFSIIPVGKNKKPIITWEEFQKRMPTEDEVRQWWTKNPDANIGIVTGNVSGICVIDLDDEKAMEAFEKMIPDTLLMPSVSTPRGGRHCYFKCSDEKLTNKAALLGHKMDFRANGGYILAPPSENGKGGKYEFLQGLSIKDIEIPFLPENLINILTSYSYNNNTSIYNRRVELQDITKPYKTLQLLTEGRRDEDLFHIANALIRAKTPINEVMQVLDILANNCNPPFPKNEIDIKIQSAFTRAEKRERHLAVEVRNWVILQTGYFSLTDIYNSLQILTKDEKNNVHVIIHRLEKEGLVEKYGKKSGQYRKLDVSVEKIDFQDDIDEEYIDVKFPFAIDDLVKTMPKNIIMVAGVSNAGKTAFLLNIVEMNMHNHDIHYFSSEMGKMEMKTRLKKFGLPLKTWKFTAYERADNFADVIKPDAINIIDFLEIYQEHYLIGQWIKDIYDKLNKGIAIIAIQRKPGAAYGVGGATTMEKARLYLSMESGRIKIEKGKNWADEMINPNGKQLTFKLVQGCKFFQTSNWEDTI